MTPWWPSVEILDGREVVRLEDLARFAGRLTWPIVELADGSLAVLVSDLVR